MSDRRRPWWHLRDDDEDEPDTLGVPGPGKVRVPTRVDEFGDLEAWAWCEPADADSWDARRWRSGPAG